MDFVSNQTPQIHDMLQAIGIRSVDELFEAVPASLRQPAAAVDDGLSEYEGIALMEELARKNTFPHLDNYLGAGAYEHHVPAIVPAICSKSEFLTSYTPYQAEASQGVLQAIFEFQSAIGALTGMDAANASVYDGASACAEGLLMALRAKKQIGKVLVMETVHPHYISAVKQYLVPQGAELVIVSKDKEGALDRQDFEDKLDASVLAILVQSPNFFGIIEDLPFVVEKAKKEGTVVVLAANPLSYGLFKTAGEHGVDIAVGDCQPFGIPLQFGGPYAGYIACRQRYLRELPGRLVGQTTDVRGNTGYVLTLQAREQHIRREKATSNICTNQTLSALASLIAMLWYGKQGIAELALANYQRAAYLRKGLAAVPGVTLMSGREVFNEFAVSFGRPSDEVQQHFRKKGIEPGLALQEYFGDLHGHFLVAVTETKTKAQLDRYMKAAQFTDD